MLQTQDGQNHKPRPFFIYFLFSTRPPPGLLLVLGPLGSGTDVTHQPGHALPWLLVITGRTSSSEVVTIMFMFKLA